MQPDQYYRTKQWFKEDGDANFNLNYELDNDSIVFEIGGYQGKWSEKIYQKFQPTLFIFEPVKEFFDSIQEKFKGNRKVHIFNFGLGAKNTTIKFNVDGDASSAFKAGSEKRLKIVDINDVFQEHKIKHVDLMNINIEGGEYDLLDRILEKDLAKSIDNLKIQFHDFAPDAENRMEQIQTNLAKTHFLTYQFHFVWENWKKKIATNDSQINLELQKIYDNLQTTYRLSVDNQKELLLSNKQVELLTAESKTLESKLKETQNLLIQATKNYENILNSQEYRIGQRTYRLLKKLRIRK